MKIDENKYKEGYIEVKDIVDKAIVDCQKIIVKTIAPLDFDKGSEIYWRQQLLMAQRITNFLWAWANPHAGKILREDKFYNENK